MKLCGGEISGSVYQYLSEIVGKFFDYRLCNKSIFEEHKIQFFFDSELDYSQMKKELSVHEAELVMENRAEYGDFQTPSSLAERVCNVLEKSKLSPTVCIEPTCGKGNFLVEAVKTFSTLKKVIGVEIYKPYTWTTKFQLLDYYLSPINVRKPIVRIYHEDVFSFDFEQIDLHNSDDLLLLGNPPWVTNSKLGELGSENLPKKSNFKKLSGLDAMTGKSNFDIAEFILVELFKKFGTQNGHVALLVKNSVIKNIIQDSHKKILSVGNFIQYEFDAKKEFNVATEASLFFAKLNSSKSLTCTIRKLENPQINCRVFGWTEGKFVSDIDGYQEVKTLDNKCQFVWRSGLKHDCSKVFELKKENGHYLNKRKEAIQLENELIYPLIKSSQIKKEVIEDSPNFVIVTQKKIGQATNYIQTEYPKLYYYLDQNRDSLNNRKSSIYRNKPPFSIFGIGNYTFLSYKIAVSGLYKELKFSLLLPKDGKPIVTDDTCYTLGFDNLKMAVICFSLLNSESCKKLLESLTFRDAKRVYTKDILMRIDLGQLLATFETPHLLNESNRILKKINSSPELIEKDIANFEAALIGRKTGQLAIFN